MCIRDRFEVLVPYESIADIKEIREIHEGLSNWDDIISLENFRTYYLKYFGDDGSESLKRISINEKHTRTAILTVTMADYPSNYTLFNCQSEYVKESITSEIIGTGFTTNGSATKVTFGGEDIDASAEGSFAINSDTKITYTAKTTEFTDVNVTVTDVAGNASTETGKLITVDNTAQTISSIDDGSAPYIFKNGTQFQIKYSGTTAAKYFTGGSKTSSSSADGQILINDTWPTGMTANVAQSAITLTAGTGEISGAVKVLDNSGNTVTATGPVIIDNTAATVSDITPDSDDDNLIHIKTGGTITVAVNFFNNGVSTFKFSHLANLSFAFAIKPVTPTKLSFLK